MSEKNLKTQRKLTGVILWKSGEGWAHGPLWLSSLNGIHVETSQLDWSAMSRSSAAAAGRSGPDQACHFAS